MRKISYSFAVALFAAAAFFGCARDKVTDTPVIPEESPGANDPITITATIANTWQAAQTRVDFDDKGAAGVELAWSAGDRIEMFNSNGKYIATFALDPACAGLKTGTFVKEYGELIDGETYTVVYPETGVDFLRDRKGLADAIVQNGNNSAEHLKNQCHMTGSFTYSAGATINFTLDYAMLSVVMATPDGYDAFIHGGPSLLTIIDGSHYYTTNISGLNTISDPLQVHVLVEPETATARSLTFELTCTNDTGASRIFTITKSTNIAYDAGRRYTANLSGSDVLSLPFGWSLADFSASDYPTEDTWVITDDIYETTPTADFDGLRAALQTAANDGRKIRLVMPDAYGLPGTESDILGGILYDCDALESVILPEATSVGEYAFAGCDNLANLNLPKVEEVKEGAFFECTGLKSFLLPEAKTIGESAFDRSGLTTANLPKAETIGVNAFSHCADLQSADLPEVTELMSGAFWGCSSLKEARFYKVTKVGEEVFVQNTSLITVSLYEATEVGGRAFSECTALEYVFLPKVTSLGTDGTFNACPNLVQMTIATESSGLTSTPSSLFGNTTDFSNINLAIGTPEVTSPGTDLATKMWRGYGPFKAITQ